MVEVKKITLGTNIIMMTIIMIKINKLYSLEKYIKISHLQHGYLNNKILFLNISHYCKLILVYY